MDEKWTPEKNIIVSLSCSLCGFSPAMGQAYPHHTTSSSLQHYTVSMQAVHNM